LVQCSRHFIRHTLDVCWKVRGTDFTTAWWRTCWMTKAKIYLCLNYLTSPHNSCIKNETCVREVEEFFLIEVPDNVRKIVIVKAQVHGVMTYITPPPFFIFFFHTLLNIILVSNNHKSTISFSLYWFIEIYDYLIPKLRCRAVQF
jgi:hypothetical protein